MSILEEYGLKLGDVYLRSTTSGDQTFVVAGEGVSCGPSLLGQPRVFLWFTPAAGDIAERRYVAWEPESIAKELYRKLEAVERVEYVHANIFDKGPTT